MSQLNLGIQPLAATFNASIREGYFPPIWKSAEVVPIPKARPPTSISNDLCPISLFPTMAKILEGIVKDWLMPTLEPVLNDGQFGSCPGRSTTHALTAIQHKWLTTLDKGGSVLSLFMDFRKPFDLVDHNILITKLKLFSIPNCLLHWFVSYLSCRRQHVSSWKSLNGSMPQGSLGPVIYCHDRRPASSLRIT